MVVSTPTFLFMCDTCFMIPAVFHEIGHQYRYEERGKRNLCLIRTIYKNLIVGVVLRLINREYAFQDEVEFQDLVNDMCSYNEMLGEGQKAISALFRSLDEWDFCNFLAECFENPTFFSEANRTDEQAVKFREYCSFLQHNDLSILDWGGGSGRLGKCMQMIEDSRSDKLKYEYEIYEPHIEDSVRDEKFVTYRNIDDIKKRYKTFTPGSK